MIPSQSSCHRLPSWARHGHAWTNRDEGHQDCHRAGAQAGEGQAENWAGQSWEDLDQSGRYHIAVCDPLMRGYKREDKARLFSTVHTSRTKGYNHKLAYLKLWLHRRKPSFNCRPVKCKSQRGCAISSRRAIQSSPSRAIPTRSSWICSEKTELPWLPWASFNLIYSMTLWSNQLSSFLVSTTPNIRRFN